MDQNMSEDSNVYINWSLDCEASQRGFDNVEFGKRSVRGFCDLVAEGGFRATLFVLPGDTRAYPKLLRQLAGEGVEVGLHVHPQEQGYADFCGAYTADEQREMYSDAIRQFADALGFVPRTFRAGSCSANDASFPLLADLGFTSCSNSMPGRRMTALKSNWVGAPAFPHFAHAANRLLEGELDLVEIPVTTDPDSMLWSGGHPQDLRVELFDAKNHRFLIDKVLAREKARRQPIWAIVGLSHNIFEFGDRSDFRAQTLIQMLADCRALADRHAITLRAATMDEIANAYRAKTGKARKPSAVFGQESSATLVQATV
jgi:peptidoglycan/xylan/chitin deacetylase (PgdA/CDA1 family)